ncbi:MAG: hypothetical protein KAI64_06110 [Thermoplasmata archaeon]|nr:hypothetical protein [Thermoplasmata archaeon]
MSAKRTTKKKPEFDFSIFREMLARLEHDQWSSWAYSILTEEEGISEERRERWQRLIDASWENLTDEEKEDDFLWADHVIGVLRDDAFNNLMLIAEHILETIYPESVFNASSGDPGPEFTVALRTTLKNVKEILEDCQDKPADGC